MSLKTCKIQVGNTFSLIDEEDYELLSYFNWWLSYGYAKTELTKCNAKHRLGVTMHEVIMRTPRDKDTDHINRIKLDNRKENLRCTTRSINMHNSKLYENNTSGVRNVYWLEAQERWMARISLDCIVYNLGHFDTIEEAEKTVRIFRKTHNLPQP